MGKKILKIAVLGISSIIFGLVLLNVETIQAVSEEKIESEVQDIIREEQLTGYETGKDDLNAAEISEYVAGEIIVKLKEGKTLTDIEELNNKFNVSSTGELFSKITDPNQELQELKDKITNLDTKHEKWYWQMDKASQEYKDYTEKVEAEKAALENQIKMQEEIVARLEQRQKRTPEGAETPNLANTYVLKANQNVNVRDMMQEYSGNSNVEYAEPNYIVRMQAFPDTLPNDTYVDPKGNNTWSSGAWGQSYEDLWGMKKIQADKIWKISQGQDVIVAVIDTGIDVSHEDLCLVSRVPFLTNIWLNARELGGKNDVDDDKNGYVDDEQGWNFGLGCTIDVSDLNGHGTHVGGIIAAFGNNNQGIIGVAPRSKLMVLKVADSAGVGNVGGSAKALKYAADNGADVINCSWATTDNSYTLKSAVDYAYSKGCVIVAAAGNGNANINNNVFPACFDNVIAVASVDHNDKKSDFSNFGTKIDISAPGGDSKDSSKDKSYCNILSLVPEGIVFVDGMVGKKYYRDRGTSMACPYVSGATALMLSYIPALTNEEVKSALVASATDVERKGFDIYTGYGRLNAYEALRIPRPCLAKITEPKINDVIYSSRPVIEIKGTASGSEFKNYKLQYIPYEYLESTPWYNDSWMRIDDWYTTPVKNNKLAAWTAPYGKYCLKLTVTDTYGHNFCDIVGPFEIRKPIDNPFTRDKDKKRFR